MITQIYSIKTVEEALDCLEGGADYIGVAVASGKHLPSEVSMQQCRAIFDAIGNRARKVMIVVTDSGEAIEEPLLYCQPDVLHLCGYDFTASPEFVQHVKSLCPGLEVLQAIGIEDESAIETAKYYGSFCDMLILDSVDRKINGIGAAGFVNDWDIDARIVEAVDCRVILAGGLGPDNVREAILKVRPWGVDSFTRTSDFFADGQSRKSREKVAAFVANAKAAFRELQHD